MLRQFMGPLLPPPCTETESLLLVVDGAALNAELVVLECLTNNPVLCYSSVPRDLIEHLGELMNSQPVTCVYSFLQIIYLYYHGGNVTGSVDLCIHRIISSYMSTIRALGESYCTKPRCATHHHTTASFELTS
jgi:hypothetical protein